MNDPETQPAADIDCGADPIELSVVVPVYRSAGTLRELVARLDATLTPLLGADAWEVVLVDDESPDDSWAVLTALAEGFPQVRLVQLMRNFGQHNAIMCGFHQAAGRLVATIDDDLQHEPESLPRLIEALRAAGTTWSTASTTPRSTAAAGTSAPRSSTPSTAACSATG